MIILTTQVRLFIFFIIELCVYVDNEAHLPGGKTVEEKNVSYQEVQLLCKNKKSLKNLKHTLISFEKSYHYNK